MVFSSAVFLFIFFPAVFILYRLTPSVKAKNYLLIMASLIFYSFGQPEYVLLLLVSSVCNYLFGIMLSRDGKRKRIILFIAVTLNLLLLGTFKYLGFIIENVNVLFNLNIRETTIALPIGISFFTFQGVSYIIDVYRDKTLATKSFTKMLLYISLFPQLVAGPIIFYHDIAGQIDSRRCTSLFTSEGLRRFIVGLSKKLLIANPMGQAADTIFAMDSASLDFRIAWIGALCYALQIYFDFSGYSDMALGLGKIFGFSFCENFNYPYTARSIKDFWRKWHISLSTWFKNYLYIPLGGNRCGRLRSEINKFIVFFCTGLWHGAEWTFVIWGLWHGLFLILEGFNIIPAKKLRKSFFGSIYTLLVVVCGFVIFRAESINQASAFFKAMLTPYIINPLADEVFYSVFNSYNIFIFVFAVVLAVGLLPFISGVCKKRSVLLFNALDKGSYGFAVVLLFMCIMSIASSTFNPFIYFRF